MAWQLGFVVTVELCFILFVIIAVFDAEATARARREANLQRRDDLFYGDTTSSDEDSSDDDDDYDDGEERFLEYITLKDIKRYLKVCIEEAGGSAYSESSGSDDADDSSVNELGESLSSLFDNLQSYGNINN
ncbi:hypothetical protein G7046_g4261 [Stylonectria norvegica]|nr:hypothetical protein G7046_g4261 [Stylonectria norvegica]